MCTELEKLYQCRLVIAVLLNMYNWLTYSVPSALSNQPTVNMYMYVHTKHNKHRCNYGFIPGTVASLNRGWGLLNRHDWTKYTAELGQHSCNIDCLNNKILSNPQMNRALPEICHAYFLYLQCKQGTVDQPSNETWQHLTHAQHSMPLFLVHHLPEK